MEIKMKTSKNPVEDQVVESTEVINEVENKDTVPKYPQEELLAIFDEILFSGEYTEDVSIKNRLKVSLRSRTAAETNSISKELDSKTFNLVMTMQQERSFLHLVYSLISYAGKDLKEMSIEKKKDFVGGLPVVIVAALSDALITFDEKINLACLEGDQNF